MAVTPTAGAKMLYLIRRRRDASRDELIMHWFANHMPGVIAAQNRRAERGEPHAWRYVATVFDQRPDGNACDGVAALWFDVPPGKAKIPHGTEPSDTFQQKAEPYVGWATREYVCIDGDLPVVPLTLNDPFPTTRSGFFKVVFLVPARPGSDMQAMYASWLDDHVPNVSAVMHEVGGFRYIVNLSIDPAIEEFAGMAELYFDDANGWERYKAAIGTDRFAEFVDLPRMLRFEAGTEMVGIP